MVQQNWQLCTPSRYHKGMLIFLYGPDEYRRIQKKKELLAQFTKKRSDLGLMSFDLASVGWRDAFQEFTRSQSLFETAKLALFENAFEVEAKELSKLLKPFVENKSITILLAERDKPVVALKFLLEKPTIAQHFENLAGAEWLSFIAQEAKQREIALTASAVRQLGAVYQGNSWALATELQKLTGYKVGKTIDVPDLSVFDLETAPNYWMLLNGLKAFDMGTRLATLERLLAMSDPPAKIFNILASQWKEKTALMAEFDFAIKSGKLDYEEALVDLAIK
jgi:DNA polymerase III delta subunit